MGQLIKKYVGKDVEDIDKSVLDKITRKDFKEEGNLLNVFLVTFGSGFNDVVKNFGGLGTFGIDPKTIGKDQYDEFVEKVIVFGKNGDSPLNDLLQKISDEFKKETGLPVDYKFLWEGPKKDKLGLFAQTDIKRLDVWAKANPDKASMQLKAMMPSSGKTMKQLVKDVYGIESKGIDMSKELRRILGEGKEDFGKKFVITPKVKEFLDQYKNVLKDTYTVLPEKASAYEDNKDALVNGWDIETGEEDIGQLTPKTATDLESTYDVFTDGKAEDEYVESAIGGMKEFAEGVLKEKFPGQSFSVEAKVSGEDSYTGSDAMAGYITLELDGDEEDVELSGLYYQSSDSEMIGPAADSWEWAAWLGIEESPFYESTWADSYCTVERKQGVAELTSYLSEGDAVSEIEKAAKALISRAESTEESVGGSYTVESKEGKRKMANLQEALNFADKTSGTVKCFGEVIYESKKETVKKKVIKESEDVIPKATAHNVNEVKALTKEAFSHGDESKYDGTKWYSHSGEFLCTSKIHDVEVELIMPDRSSVTFEVLEDVSEGKGSKVPFKVGDKVTFKSDAKYFKDYVGKELTVDEVFSAGEVGGYEQTSFDKRKKPTPKENEGGVKLKEISEPHLVKFSSIELVSGKEESVVEAEKQVKIVGKDALERQLKELEFDLEGYLDDKGIKLPDGQTLNFVVKEYSKPYWGEEKKYFYPEMLNFKVEAYSNHFFSLLADGRIIPEGMPFSGEGITKERFFEIIADDVAHWRNVIDRNAFKRKKKSSPVDEAKKKEQWVIQDWAGNYPFNKYHKSGPGVSADKTFASFEDAEDFLADYLGDNYEQDRQEYEIVQKLTKEDVTESVSFRFSGKDSKVKALKEFLSWMRDGRIENDANSGDFDSDMVGRNVEDQLTGVFGKVNGKETNDIFKAITAGMSEDEISDIALSLDGIEEYNDGWIYYESDYYINKVEELMGKKESVSESKAPKKKVMLEDIDSLFLYDKSVSKAEFKKKVKMTESKEVNLDDIDSLFPVKEM